MKKFLFASLVFALLACAADAVTLTATNQPNVRRAELIDNLRAGQNALVVDVGALNTAYTGTAASAVSQAASIATLTGQVATINAELPLFATNATLTLQYATMVTNTNGQDVTAVTNVSITIQR